MEMNVEETKIMRMSRQPSPIPFIVDQAQLENVECFNCVGSVITNDDVCVCVCVVCVCEIRSKTVMAKTAFNKKTDQPRGLVVRVSDY